VRAALLPYTPRFEMKLVDLSPGKASDLAEQALTALGQVVLWCLSVAGDDARLEREIGRIGRALDAVLAAKDAVAALTALLRYLPATHASVGAPKMVRLLENAASAGQKKVVVDVLDVFRKEGREEGKREGRAEGKREGRAEGKREGRAKTLLEQLAARFGPVPAEAKAKVLAAKEATLARWSLRVLTAPTLAAVLDGRAKGALPARRPSRPTRARTTGRT
jgi:hypothetical protein